MSVTQAFPRSRDPICETVVLEKRSLGQQCVHPVLPSANSPGRQSWTVLLGHRAGLCIRLFLI